MAPVVGGPSVRTTRDTSACRCGSVQRLRLGVRPLMAGINWGSRGPVFMFHTTAQDVQPWTDVACWTTTGARHPYERTRLCEGASLVSDSSHHGCVIRMRSWGIRFLCFMPSLGMVSFSTAFFEWLREDLPTPASSGPLRA